MPAVTRSAITCRASVPSAARAWSLELQRGGSAEVLLGTVYCAYVGSATDWRVWELILDEEVRKQKSAGANAGSWDADPGETRVESTARHLLAWTVPQATFRTPRR